MSTYKYDHDEPYEHNKREKEFSPTASFRSPDSSQTESRDWVGGRPSEGKRDPWCAGSPGRGNRIGFYMHQMREGPPMGFGHSVTLPQISRGIMLLVSNNINKIAVT